MTVENTLSPGPIDPPISGEAGLNEEQVTQYKKGMTPLIPLGRIAMRTKSPSRLSFWH
jgi:hypothetical protein